VQRHAHSMSKKLSESTRIDAPIRSTNFYR
jgi:hypothetical protein